MPTTVPTINTLPTPPLKTDPANFAERADDFLGALPDFQVEQNASIGAMNTLGSELEGSASDASTSASTAAAASSAALANANATVYDAADEPYDPPSIVIGSDGNSYRCLVEGLSGDNPVGSTTGAWLQITFSAGAVYVVAVDFAAATSGTYLVDTTSSTIEATLPSAPAPGATVYLIDYNSTFGTNKLVVDGNGKKIMGVLEDMDVEEDNATLSLMFINDTVGWRLF